MSERKNNLSRRSFISGAGILAASAAAAGLTGCGNGKSAAKEMAKTEDVNGIGKDNRWLSKRAARGARRRPRWRNRRFWMAVPSIW